MYRKSVFEGQQLHHVAGSPWFVVDVTQGRASVGKEKEPHLQGGVAPPSQQHKLLE